MTSVTLGKLRGDSICADTDTDTAAIKIETVEMKSTWFHVHRHGYSNGSRYRNVNHLAIYAAPYRLTDGYVSHLHHFLCLFSPFFLACEKARVIQPCLRSAKSQRMKQVDRSTGPWKCCSLPPKFWWLQHFFPQTDFHQWFWTGVINDAGKKGGKCTALCMHRYNQKRVQFCMLLRANHVHTQSFRWMP